ncbi:MAG: peptidylprolyl isomerase [Casimicrobiaceae bacterium]|nr:peptidylprolyl isomerase [Casimicrobiaceae bacterium]MDW8312482.1 peptidylprolyl isomerase [Burkholderiales bacterium]
MRPHIRLSTAALVAATVATTVAAQASAPAPARRPAPTAAPPATAAPAPATKSAEDELVSKAQFDLILQERLAQGHPDSPELRAALREELLNRELIVRAAKAKNLDKEALVRTQMQAASETVLIRAYLSEFFRSNPIPEEALRKEYETIRAGLGDKEYRARHILVEKREEAEAVIKQLQAGANFAEIAKAQSKDPGSRENGGDLDWAVPSNYVKPFADAMVALQKGKFTPQPVQTPFGYHVILLEDVRPAQIPAFEEVRAQLTQRLQQQALERHVEELRTKAGIRR